jgi:signal transduction histidine kinase
LGKLDEGKIMTDPVQFNGREMLEDCVEELKGLLRKDQQVQLTFSGTENIFTDKKLLKNIVFNLVSNAIKFSDEGSSINIGCAVNNGTAKLSISDKGIGISPEDQKHLFSSFFRGANAANIQGTGLGLHIVKRYADLLNGKVNLQSELNKGTTITVEFPAEP